MMKFPLIVAIVSILAIATFVRTGEGSKAELTPDETITFCIANGQRATVMNGLRFYADSLSWHDELTKNDTFNGVVNATIHDNGNALAFNVLVHHVMNFFGNTNFSLRLLSIFCGLLIVISTYLFCQRQFDTTTAILSALLLALHPFLIDYSQLGRGYILAALCSLWATIGFFKFFNTAQPQIKTLFGYACLVIVGLLCHYFTLFIFTAHGLIALYHYRIKSHLQWYIPAAVSAVAVVALWIFTGGLEGQRLMAAQSQNWETELSSATATHSLISDIAFRTNNLVNALFGSKMYHLNLPYFLEIISALFFVVFLVYTAKKHAHQRIFQLLFLVVFYFICITAIAIFSGHILSFDIRYAAPIMPFAIIALAYGLTKFQKQFKWLGGGLIASIVMMQLITGFPDLVFNVIRPNINMNELRPITSDAIFKQSSTNDTIIYPSVTEAILTNLYFPEPINATQLVLQKMDPDYIDVVSSSGTKRFHLHEERYK
jgi:uncharacterized membrane protein